MVLTCCNRCSHVANIIYADVEILHLQEQGFGKTTAQRCIQLEVGSVTSIPSSVVVECEFSNWFPKVHIGRKRGTFNF